jgi:hypothetical protein
MSRLSRPSPRPLIGWGLITLLTLIVTTLLLRAIYGQATLRLDPATRIDEDGLMVTPASPQWQALFQRIQDRKRADHATPSKPVPFP